VTKRARATKRAMALATRVECDKESNGFGSKSNCDEGSNNQLVMGAWDKEGKGGKAMAIGIRVMDDVEGEGNKEGNVVGNEGGLRQREQWLWWQERWQQGWQAIDGNKGDGDGDGNNVGDGDGDEAGGRLRGQGRGGQGRW
jgi:hypothetical protein